MTESERRIAAIAHRHGAETSDVEKAVAYLADIFDARPMHVVVAIEDMDVQPHAPAFEART